MSNTFNIKITDLSGIAKEVISNDAVKTNKRNVNIVVKFIRIGEIDTMNEKYQAEIDVEARWIEIENINNYDPKKHWNPLLYVENLLNETKQLVEYTMGFDENNNRVITERRNIKGVFWERLELENFPVDVQELSVTVCSNHNNNEIILINDEENLSYINMDASNTFIDQQKWRLFNLVKISYVASYDLPTNHKSSNKFNNDFMKSKKPKFCATCFCARKPGYYISNAIFLIFLITLCSINVFSIDVKFPQNRLQVTVTLILTSVSFKWVINRSLPTVAYMTSLDKYAVVSIFYLCLVAAWHSIVGSFWSKDLAILLDHIFLGIFSFLFILIQVVYVVWMFRAKAKIRQLERDEKQFISELNEKLTQATIRSKFISRI